LFAASEVRAAEYCGLAAVSSVAGLARSTIERGLKAAWRRRLPAAAFAVQAAGRDGRISATQCCSTIEYRRWGPRLPPHRQADRVQQLRRRDKSNELT
jgi:hypothetical protein